MPHMKLVAERVCWIDILIMIDQDTISIGILVMNSAGNEFYWGIIVASLAYLLKNFVFDQILEFQKVKGRIRNRLRYYANAIDSTSLNEKSIQEVWSEFRQLSCDLEEKYFAIFILVRLRVICWLFALPSKNNITEVSASLIYLSNSVGDEGENCESPANLKEEVDKIKSLLLTGSSKKIVDNIRRFFKSKG